MKIALKEEALTVCCGGRCGAALRSRGSEVPAAQQRERLAAADAGVGGGDVLDDLLLCQPMQTLSP